MLFFRCTPLVLAACALGVRRLGRQDPLADGVACPILSALVSAGHLTPGSSGTVSDSTMKAALQEAGASAYNAAFQAAGIVGYEETDTNQLTRLTGTRATSTTKYINLYNMNPLHECDTEMSNTAAGYPCNINPQFQQHGYSTFILDPTDGSSAQERFDAVFEAATILETIDGVDERVLTAEGMVRLLYNARVSGDVSGENSLNSTWGLSGSKIAYYHPSVSASSNYLVLSQWQACLAWGGFWEVLRRESPSGQLYIPLSDLESIFLDGKFPDDFVKRDWGFGSIFSFISSYVGGSGAGDEFVASIDSIISTYGEDADEYTLYVAFYSLLLGLGAFTDNVANPDPSR